MLRIFFLFLILYGSSCVWAEFYADWEPTKIGAKKNKEEPHQRLSSRAQLKMRDTILANTKETAYRKGGYRHWMWSKDNYGLMQPSANEFSGALWAHGQGITGKGSLVGVMERKGIPSVIKPDSKTKFLDVSQGGDEHAIHVADVVRQIAPDCQIEMLPMATKLNLTENPFISVNLSWSTKIHMKKEESAQQFIDGFSSLKSRTLFIVGAGNDGQSLSLGSSDADSDTVASLPHHFAKDAGFRNDLILVGALKPTNEKLDESNSPGADRDIQNCFIWTLGEDVFGRTSRDRIEKGSGTSLAAPIVTGAVALLKQKFPRFKAPQIREIILESADRSFWCTRRTAAYNPKGSIKEKESQEITMYIFNPEGSDAYRAIEKEKIEALKKAGIEIVDFDPSVDGKGILNIRNAFTYGKLKLHHSDWNVDQLRSAMLESLAKRNEKAATVIQKNWSAHKERKKK